MLRFGLTFGFKLRYRCVFMSVLCPVQVYLNVRFVLELEFMLTSKFVLVSGLYICLRYFHVLALVRV